MTSRIQNNFVHSGTVISKMTLCMPTEKTWKYLQISSILQEFIYTIHGKFEAQGQSKYKSYVKVENCWSNDVT